MPVFYTPTPVPAIPDNRPLQVYLDSEFRRVAGSQEEQLVEGVAILYSGTVNDVGANDTTEAAIDSYNESFTNDIIAVDQVAGSFTLPNAEGLVELNTWISMTQVTVTRNFTVQLMIEVNGLWFFLTSGYIPQNGVSVNLGLSASFIREVAGNEVIRFGLLLDGASPAVFAIPDCSFELRYITVRG